MPEYGINGTTHNLSAIQMKFKLAAEWQATDTLLAGEIGVEKDTHKMKVGDGLTTWGNLPYSSDPHVQELVDALTSRLDNAESTIASHGSRLDAAEGTIASQGTRLTTAEGAISAAESRLDSAEGDIDALEAKDTQHETRMTTIEGKDTAQDGRLDALEGVTILSANPFRE